MAAKPPSTSKSKGKIKAAFDEVYSNVPSTVKATGKTGKAKQKMMTAVALSKARQAGARIPGPRTRKVTSY